MKQERFVAVNVTLVMLLSTQIVSSRRSHLYSLFHYDHFSKKIFPVLCQAQIRINAIKISFLCLSHKHIHLNYNCACLQKREGLVFVKMYETVLYFGGEFVI